MMRRKRFIYGGIGAVIVIAGVLALSLGLRGNSHDKAASAPDKPKTGTFNIKSLVEGIMNTAPTASSSSDTDTPSIVPISPQSAAATDGGTKPALTFAQEVDQRDQTALVPAVAVKAILSGMYVGRYDMYVCMYVVVAVHRRTM